jgi:tetratricopeptide (TPR) repeat protein
MPFAPAREGDLENTNPLWLKDKADRFMNDKNYTAALDAYTQTLKIDPSHRKALMNRSMAHIKLFSLDAAIHDCDVVLLLMQK